MPTPPENVFSHALCAALMGRWNPIPVDERSLTDQHQRWGEEVEGWKTFSIMWHSLPKLAGEVILSGGDGDDAKDYQEKQVRNAIREATK